MKTIHRLLAIIIAGVAVTTVLIPRVAAQVSYPPADTSTVVRKVGGQAPDASGNVALPNTFTASTCSGCTMTSPTLTGTPTLNGNPLVSSVNGARGDVTVAAYTDAMAVAANAASLATVSSVASAAAKDVVQVVTPATGATVTASTGTTILLVNNTGTLVSLTVTFPSSPVDGQRFGVLANNPITTMGFTGGTGRGLLTTFSANGFARFVYSASVGAWLRAG